MTENHLKIADGNTKLGAWVEERSNQKHKRVALIKTADDECAPIFVFAQRINHQATTLHKYLHS